jgi:FPC/CPF motif-containing protein YcgG
VTATPARAAQLDEEVHAAFRALLRDPEFPCLGAKSILNRDSYGFGLYDELAGAESTASLARDLWRFLERPSTSGGFSSYVASFLRPKTRTPKEFEQLLWQQLLGLHRASSTSHRWNETVSSDPQDPAFSFSFGGRAFFVVGLSPSSARWARRFPWPTLVFNEHEQFERLRRERRFDRLRDAIRLRDARVHGSANDMLADYGRHSEARQYAGRRVGERWRCPVSFERQDRSDA